MNIRKTLGNNIQRCVETTSELIKLTKRKGTPLFFCISSDTELNKFIKKKAILHRVPYIILNEYTPGTVGNKDQVRLNNEEFISLKKFNYIIIFDAHGDAEKEVYKLSLPVLDLKAMDNTNKKVWATLLPLVTKKHVHRFRKKKKNRRTR